MLRRGGLAFLLAACSADPAPVRDVVEVDVPPQLAATSTASAPLSVESASRSIASSTPAAPEVPMVGLTPPGIYPPGLLPPGLFPPPSAGASGVPQTSATSISPASASGLGAALRTLAAASTSGKTTPLGSIDGARFNQGDVLVVGLQLSPTQCLTAVAVSDTIAELDLELHVAMPPGMGMPPMMLAQDNTTGPRAVLGGTPNCFKNPLPMPMPMVLVVRARQGAGAALVQTFVQP